MRHCRWMLPLVLCLVAGGTAQGGDSECCPPPQEHFWKRWHPVGGWNPYGGSLFHWWNPHCFPKCGGPDDYCRKPIPRVCWAQYPPFYIVPPAEIGHAGGNR